MEASFTLSDGNIAEIEITASPDEVAKYIDEAYSAFATRGRYPGFRPGKVPRQVIDVRVGRPAVLADALESLVEDLYPLAIDTTGLRPIEPADNGALDELEDGKPYTFTAKVQIKPELKLNSEAQLKIEAKSATATEREIDAQVENMRERFASLVPIDRGVEIGDFALVSFVNRVDGEEVEGSRVDKYLYETGRSIMPDEFEGAILGAKAGETVHAEFLIPETSSVPQLVGKITTFDIEVHEVKAKELPPLDDEFASNVGGFDSYEALRDDIRAKMEEAKATGRIREIEAAARRALAERLEGEVPEVMIANRVKQHTEDFFDNLRQRNISIEDYVAATGVQPEQIQADIADMAEGVLREELALEALFRAQDMEVTEEELDHEIAEISGSEPGATERMRDRLRQTGMIPLLKEQVMHKKATRWLMDNVEVEDAEPESGETAAEPAPAKKRGKKAAATEQADEPAAEEE